jgi:hypothetical protein
MTRGAFRRKRGGDRIPRERFEWRAESLGFVLTDLGALSWGKLVKWLAGGYDDEEEGEALLSPETFFTKICIVSASSGDADREIGDEEGMVSGVR